MIPAIRAAGRFFSSSCSSSSRRTAVAAAPRGRIWVSWASEGEDAAGNAGGVATAGSVCVAWVVHTAVSGAFT